mgnify:CR=1 FL=1
MHRNDTYGVIDVITPAPIKPVFWWRPAIIDAAYFG